MSDLVSQLSKGLQPVEVSLRPERTVDAFRECIDAGYVHILFPKTEGGTELGVRLDRSLCDLESADFWKRSGHVKLVGNLTLDYTRVRCSAEIDLATLAGKGKLEAILQ
jgi:hypothetical protein